MKIIFATDGSGFSHAAIERCAELLGNPAEIKAKVVAVYEAPVPMAAEPFAISADYYQHLEKIARNRASDAVTEAFEILKKRLGPDIDVSSEVELGIPAEVIVDIAEQWKADLIVVGSHGHGFWGRMLLGSVSDAVSHHAPCSVLIVRTPKKDG
jgi:nucleotide-binding universal stress UspA family protein